MSYADTFLADGEHITYRAKQHWLAPLSEARNAVLVLLVSLVLLFLAVFVVHPDGVLGQAWGGLTLILFVVSLAWIGKVYLAWSAEDYIVTDRRVLKVEGIVNKHAADSSLDKINDAVVEQHLLGRMFGYGDLEILTAAEESVDRYHMIAHVLVFKRSMLNAKHDVEQGTRGIAAPPLRAPVPMPPVQAPAPAAIPAAPSTSGPVTPPARPAAPVAHQMTPDEITKTLSRLADLRDRGAITPEEYETKKADLLSRI